MSIVKGHAPCGQCGRHAWDISLIEESIEPDGHGGYWWQAVDGQSCPDCGEPFLWYHKSADVLMELPIVVELPKVVQDEIRLVRVGSGGGVDCSGALLQC